MILSPNLAPMFRTLLLSLLLFPLMVSAQSISNQAAVQAAAEDYLYGFYDAAPERLDRTLRDDVQKVGFWRNGEGEYVYTTMTKEQALQLATTYNADDHIPDNAPREVEVLAVNDMTATAKVTAVWGIDYLHLGNFDGNWQIINIIWQSAPPESGN